MLTLALAAEIQWFRAMMWQEPLRSTQSMARQLLILHWFYNDKLIVRMAGGTPIAFGTIGVCDGIAMNHTGMKYSLASREIIADSVEIMAQAHPFDALVMIPNCDKVTPGMLMAMLRVNIPSIMVSGGPMLTGRFQGKDVHLVSVFSSPGQCF